MLRKIMTIAALAGLTALLGSPGGAQQQQGGATRWLNPPGYVFNPDLPHDVVTQFLGATEIQPFADIMAWDAFIAVNWPVPSPIGERGVPDRQNVIGGLYAKSEGGTSSLPPGPTVWETYKNSDEIYLDPPTPPSPFDSAKPIPPQCLLQAQENPLAATHIVERTAKISTALNGIHQADGNRLIDQNGENVWYEVKLNRVYYDYVVRNGFYDSRNQINEGISFPLSSNVTSQEPTVKVKAAWKVMGMPGSRQPDDPTKFYTRLSLTLDPATNTCTVQLLGLVGLHVVMKSRLLPQWLWATFEHVNNAPDQATGPAAGTQYNFFDTKCGNACPPVNTPPAKGSTTPTQVVRVTPIDSGAGLFNTSYKTALQGLRPDNVWQNYVLVDAQWSPSRAQIGVPEQPKFLANTTLETYMQAQTEPYGCINCHGGTGVATDFDFQLAYNAYPRNTSRILQFLRIPGVATMRRQ